MVELYQVMVSGGRIEIRSGNKFVGERVFSRDIVKTIQMPDGVLVLLDYYNTEAPWKSLNNLLFLGFDARLLWEAELPSTAGGNAYVDVEIDNGQIKGTTWGGELCTLNKATGKILDIVWVK